MARDGDEKPGGAQVANLVLALLVHAFVGIPWLVFVSALAYFAFDAGGLVWGLSGFTLLAIGLVDAIRGVADAGAVWGAVLRSWLWVLGGPIALATIGIRRLRPDPAPAPGPPPQLDPLEEPVNPEVERRLDVLAQQLEALRRELAEVCEAPPGFREVAESRETFSETARP
jgi:hypothetical protein